jgi:hypothetical protein
LSSQVSSFLPPRVSTARVLNVPLQDSAPAASIVRWAVTVTVWRLRPPPLSFSCSISSSLMSSGVDDFNGGSSRSTFGKR